MPTTTRTALAALLLTLVAALAACGGGDEGGAAASPDAPLRVGATPVPHAEILEYVAEDLAPEAGLRLEVREFSDYVQPNTALGEGGLDANYFQSMPYLEDQRKARGLDLVDVADVHLEPLGLYSRKVDDIAELQPGAQIAIPNDATNAGRALLLLQANGLLRLREGADQSADVRDIAQNPRDLEIVEVEAAQTPRSLDDVDAAVINGNFALEAGLKPAQDALVLERPEGNPNVNVLATLGEDRDDPRVRKLAQLLRSPEVKQFIERKYEGAVLPVA